MLPMLSSSLEIVQSLASLCQVLPIRYQQMPWPFMNGVVYLDKGLGVAIELNGIVDGQIDVVYVGRMDNTSYMLTIQNGYQSRN